MVRLRQVMRRDANLVIAELHGRLGNQLFQFASAYAIAETRGAKLRFAVRDVEPSDLVLPNLIGERYVEASARELSMVGQCSEGAGRTRAARAALGRLGLNAARRLRGSTPAVAVYRSDTGRYRPEVFHLDLPVYLKAHLESERYFESFSREICSAIRWPDDSVGLPPSTAPAVAVSFRRGDFNSLGRTLPLAYYERAL